MHKGDRISLGGFARGTATYFVESLVDVHSHGRHVDNGLMCVVCGELRVNGVDESMMELQMKMSVCRHVVDLWPFIDGWQTKDDAPAGALDCAPRLQLGFRGR